MKLLLLLALATQTLTFHPRQWRAEWEPLSLPGARYPAGRYQHITGKPKWLNLRLWYDEQMKLWEVEQGIPGTAAAGWTPIYEGDVLTLEESGYIRIKGL